MVPINHLDDSMGLDNQDSDVPEHQHRDESYMQQTGKQVSGSCSTSWRVSVASKPPHESGKEAASEDSESATQPQASSKSRSADKNRSSSSSEKHRHRDKDYRHKVDNGCQKPPSDPNTQILAMPDKVSNRETAALTETVNDRSSGDYDDGHAKPTVPSRCSQNSSARRSSNHYVHSRNHFSGAYSKYSDDYVLQPRRCNDTKRNRRPKSAKTAAEAVCDDPGNDLDEDSNDSHNDRVVDSSGVAAESNSAGTSRSYQNKSNFSGVPCQRRSNGRHSFQSTMDRLTSAELAKSVKVSKGNDVQRERGAEEGLKSDSSASAEHKCVKQADMYQTNAVSHSQGVTSQRQRNNHARHSTHLAKEQTSHDDQQCEQDLADVSSSFAEKEPYQKTGGSRRGARRNFHRRSQPGDNPRSYDSETVPVDRQTEVLSTSVEQKHAKQSDTYPTNTDNRSQGLGSQRRSSYHTRPSTTHSTKEPTSHDDQQFGQDQADVSSPCAEKEPYQKTGGSRRGARRNFRGWSQPGNNPRSYDNETVPVDRHTEVLSTSAEQKHAKQSDTYPTNTDNRSQGLGSQRRSNYHTRPSTTHSTKEPTSHDDQQFGQDQADVSSPCAEKKPYQKTGGSRRGARRNFHRRSQPDDNPCSYDSETVPVDRQTEVLSTSAEQKHAKQSDTYPTNTDNRSQGLGSQRRSNYHTRPSTTHSTKEPTSHDDQQFGQDQADVSSPCAEKEPYQKTGGSGRGARRNFHRRSQPGENPRSYDSETVPVDRYRETELPSTNLHQNTSSSHSRPP